MGKSLLWTVVAFSLGHLSGSWNLVGPTTIHFADFNHGVNLRAAASTRASSWGTGGMRLAMAGARNEKVSGAMVEVRNADQRRQDEHDNLLSGKRRMSASDMDAKSIWKLLPPDMLKKYELKGELGRGTFGCVLDAQIKKSGERVAIKLCRAQEGEMPIIIKEGLMMKRVKSKNVAELKEFGCSSGDNLVWFVIELLEGRTLDDIIISNGPLPVQEACRVGLDILNGLRDIHQAGLIHRDIKPQNIIRVPSQEVDRKWTYKVIDFGSAVAALGPERFALPSFVIPYGAKTPADLEKIFATVDRTGGGRIGTGDVLHIFESLDIQVSLPQIEAFVGRYDVDGDGSISEKEFTMMFAELASLPYASRGEDSEHINHLNEVFNSLDRNGDTNLSLGEIKGAFMQLNRQPTHEQLLWLMFKYDEDHDDMISFEEFRLMYGELVALQDSMNLQGTHGYMPPEQYNNMILSPASDIWSLGATLFRSVSGQLPFTITGGTWGKGLIGDLSIQAPKLGHVVFGISPLFEQIVEKSLRKDSLERFKDAAQMRQELALVYAKLSGK